MTTRTHVVYFSTDALDDLTRAAAELAEDWQQRRDFVAREAREAVERRLGILQAALGLLAEPVTDFL